MKKIPLIVFFLTWIIFPAISQTTVSVISDSAATVVYRVKELAQLAEQIQNGIETIEAMNSMLKYQAQALEELSEGSWDGFVDFMDKEASSMASFDEAVNDLQTLDNIYDIIAPNTMSDLDSLSESLNAVMDKTNSMVKATDNLVTNLPEKVELLQKSAESMKTAEGLSGKLEAQGQELETIGSILSDIQTVLYATEKQAATVRDVAASYELQGQYSSDSFFYGENSYDDAAPYDSGTAPDELETAIEGGNFDLDD